MIAENMIEIINKKRNMKFIKKPVFLYLSETYRAGFSCTKKTCLNPQRW